jgi:hypothetical protein
LRLIALIRSGADPKIAFFVPMYGLDPAEPAKEEKLASQLTRLLIQFIEKV